MGNNQLNIAKKKSLQCIRNKKKFLELANKRMQKIQDLSTQID